MDGIEGLGLRCCTALLSFQSKQMDGIEQVQHERAAGVPWHKESAFEGGFRTATGWVLRDQALPLGFSVLDARFLT